jgi:RNA polymerase sigma-70 factor (ECF subfamily)
MAMIGAAVALPSEDEAGEADAFARELSDVAATALRLARTTGCSAEEAADVVQDAAISAWRHREQRLGDFRPWFLAIVRRRAMRRRRPIPLLPAFWSPRAEEWPRTRDLDPDLAAAMRALPPRQRTALWLRYGCDLSTAATAEVLETSETACKQLLLRAREALRRRLGEDTA